MTLYEIGVFDQKQQDFEWEWRLSHGFKNMKRRVLQLAKKNPNCEVLAQPYDKEYDCIYGGCFSVFFENGQFKILNLL